VRIILIILLVIARLAYLTILERRVLRYFQFRKGPDKAGFLGLLQPFSNGFERESELTGTDSSRNYTVNLSEITCNQFRYQMIYETRSLEGGYSFMKQARNWETNFYESTSSRFLCYLKCYLNRIQEACIKYDDIL